MVRINRMDTINNDPVWIYEAVKKLARFQSETGFDKTMEKLRLQTVRNWKHTKRWPLPFQSE